MTGCRCTRDTCAQVGLVQQRENKFIQFFPLLHNMKPDERKVKGGFSWFVAFAAGTGGFLFGYEVGIVDTVLVMPQFQVQFGTGAYSFKTNRIEDTADAAELNGNIVSSFLFGAIGGGAIGWWLADLFGRRKAILLGTVLFAIGGLIQTFSYTLLVLYMGRFISGIGIGILSMVVPIYISEVAPKEKRGQLVSVQQLMITLGIFAASVFNAILFYGVTGDVQWRGALGIQVVPGVLLMLILLFLPYSPRWLLHKNRYAEAVNVLAKLRSLNAKHEDVMTEYLEIKHAIEAEREAGSPSWLEMFSRRDLRSRVLVGMSLQFFQQWTGINVVLYYAGHLFQRMGQSKELSSAGLVILTSSVFVLATLPAMYLIEKIGRRRLLVYGGISMAMSHILVTVFSYLRSQQIAAESTSILAVSFICVFVISFGSTWGPVAWVYQSEIFPIQVRAKGTATATVINWTMNALIGKFTPILLNRMGSMIYLIFAGMCIIMTIFAQYGVPETTGRSLEDMNDVFEEPAINRARTINLPEDFKIRLHREESDGTNHDVERLDRLNEKVGLSYSVPSSSSKSSLSPLKTAAEMEEILLEDRDKPS
ncbi:hypothetical protein HK098_003813 [Nowakowskiella sp. JEL0407]|nr:hypothetical protein HK098_003813 [Nowakowskiella sp. JEL0407]